MISDILLNIFTTMILFLVRFVVASKLVPVLLVILEMYRSSISSHCCSYSHCFNFTKACIVSFHINTYHLNFYEAFYILKKSNNLVNDLSSAPSTSDAWKLLV